jgi:hypothetical protein
MKAEGTVGTTTCYVWKTVAASGDPYAEKGKGAKF